jgi:hypothetical protein
MSINTDNLFKKLKYGSTALYLELVSFVPIMSPFYDLDRDIVWCLTAIIPYFTIFYSLKSVLKNLSSIKEVYRHIYNILFVILLPFYILASGYIINIALSLKGDDCIRALILVNTLLVFVLCESLLFTNIMVEIAIIIACVILVSFYGIIGYLWPVIATTIIRVFKLKILIQDFIIYNVDEHERVVMGEIILN